MGIAITLVAYMFFIVASFLVQTFPSHFSIVQIVFIQYIASLVFLFPLFYVKKTPGIKTKEVPVHLIRAFAAVISWYLYFVAIRFLGLVDATTLNYTSPFFVPFFWWIWMKERVGRNVWWAIVVGFIGVSVILNPTKEIFQLGFVLGLFAGILAGVSLCGMRVLSIKQEPKRRIMFYLFCTGAILSFPFAMVYWVTPTPEQWVKMVLIGFMTTCGQILLTVAYRYGTASYLSPLSYVSVVFAGIIGYFFLDNPLEWRTLIGTALIVLGGSATYILKKKPKSVAETFKTSGSEKKPPL